MASKSLCTGGLNIDHLSVLLCSQVLNNVWAGTTFSLINIALGTVVRQMGRGRWPAAGGSVSPVPSSPLSIA